MSKFLISIVIAIILAALVVSVYAGVSLVTMIYEDEEFFLPDIPELKTGLDEDIKFDKIEKDGNIQPTSNLHPESTSKIDFQFEKSVYSDQVSIMTSGIISHPNFSEKTYLDVYNVDNGEQVKKFVFLSSDIVSNDGKFYVGFGLLGDHFGNLYNIVISHNGVNASKIFTVERSDIDDTKNRNWDKELK